MWEAQRRLLTSFLSILCIFYEKENGMFLVILFHLDYSLWKLNKASKESSAYIHAEYVWSLGELTHTQELMCSLISSSWLWHPYCIVCLVQTCQAWLSAQQDLCLVRSYVSTAVFRRSIKVKVTAIAPLHETWVHQHFGPDAAGMDPYCNRSNIFIQVLHTLFVLFVNPFIFQSPIPVIAKKNVVKAWK